MHLVLLPGLDGTGKLFSPLLEQFPDRSNITVITYPGDCFIPFDELHEYLIPQLPQNEPMVLLGESYSGPVALSLAARGDLDIRGLILVATFARYPDSILKMVGNYVPLSLLFRLPIPDWFIRHYCFPLTTKTELYDMLRQSVRDNTPRVLAMRARDGSRIDVTNLLERVDIPSLYIAADNDRLVPPRAIEHLRTYLAGLEIITLPTTHFVLQMQPAACHDIICTFMEKID